MATRITVRDPDSGHEVMVDVEDETVVEEVVESVAKYWDKPTGAYRSEEHTSELQSPT